jgi:uncharacterized caspase-like protein
MRKAGHCDQGHINCARIVIVSFDVSVGFHCRFGSFLMRALLGIVLTIWLTLLAGQPALADRRVALVIGNSGYQNVARLGNPANDAAAMAETFKGAGFDLVETRRDLKTSEMRRVLRDFSDKARDADVAVVYYAGHGIEVDGTNYLIPVDAVLERDIDIYDEAFALDRILVTIEPAKQLRLVILDACRDNPFARTMKRTIGSRAIGRGLAKVEPNSPNTLIAYASKAGSTASDGDSKNSPFTAALVKHIAKPGLDLRKAFGFVRDDVLKNTGNRQEPYVYGSLGGDDVPLVPAKPVASTPPVNANDAVRRDYELALQLGTREGWTAFLAQFPEGFYANLAKGQLNKIASEEARIAATEKARSAEEEKTRLRAEGARQAEQVKAAAQAKAAEDARIAAEKAKQVQQEKVAAAEQARAAVEKLAAEKLAAQKAAAEKPADADRQMAGNGSRDDSQRVASLPAPSGTALSPTELITSVQLELRRVGCLATLPNGEWSVASQRSLTLFNKYAGTKFDVKLASIDAFDAIKAKPARVCPPICDHGFRADGDRCTKITCRPGYEVGDENSCEKIEVKRPKREELRALRDRPERAKGASEPAKPQSTESPQAKFANSPTCTNVRAACEKTRSKLRVGSGHCASSFAACMRTGTWKSSYSYYEGLARR